MTKKKKMKVVYSEQFQKDFIRLFSSNLIYAIPRWFGDAKMEIKHAWQRIFRKIDDPWYWNLNSMLAETIPKCVRAMRKDGMGYPSDLTNKEWKIILKKIEEGFEAYQKMDDSPYSGKLYNRRKKKFDEGMKLFSKHFFSLWD